MSQPDINQLNQWVEPQRQARLPESDHPRLSSPSAQVEIIDQSLSRTVIASEIAAQAIPLDDLSRSAQQRIIRLWRRRARRNTKANRDFYELRVRRCQAWASREIPADWLSQFLFSPERVLNHPTTQHIKQSQYSTVAVIPGPTQPVMVKRISPRYFAERWTARWRRSPALHCYRMAYRLQTAGLPTPRPLAIIEQVRHGQLLASYVLSEYLSDTLHLGDYWPQASELERRQTLDALADILQRLHLYGMSHRDLKVTNILARPRSHQAAELFLIDLGGVSHGLFLSRYRARKDLARLALSATITLRATRTDLLRFLKRYLTKEQQPQWQSWWRYISLFMNCKARQNVRRNRELS